MRRVFSTLQASDEAELEALCAEISSQHHSGESPDSPSRPCCTFTYITMTGEEVELCQGGRSLIVRYRNPIVVLFHPHYQLFITVSTIVSFSILKCRVFVFLKLGQ